jgi:S-formylglutathione hydrolase FrmB
VAHIELNALCVNLAGTFGAHIYLPELGKLGKKQYPVLWFIHDDGGSDADLLRFPVLEEYAMKHEVFVIAPTVSHSLATDMAYGTENETFLADECPRLFQFLYPLSKKKEDNILFGVGTGAYGAVKLALKHQDTFGGCISISGKLDIAAVCEAAANNKQIWPHQSVESLKAIFGDLNKVRSSQNDIFAITKKESELFLYLTCGEQEEAYQENLRLADIHKEAVTDFREGATTKEAIDAMIQRALEWLAVSKGAN